MKPISQQPDHASLSYFKLTLFDPPEFIVWNIYGLRHLVLKKLGFKNPSLLQRLNSFCIEFHLLKKNYSQRKKKRSFRFWGFQTNERIVNSICYNIWFLKALRSKSSFWIFYGIFFKVCDSSSDTIYMKIGENKFNKTLFLYKKTGSFRLVFPFFKFLTK